MGNRKSVFDQLTSQSEWSRIAVRAVDALQSMHCCVKCSNSTYLHYDVLWGYTKVLLGL